MGMSSSSSSSDESSRKSSVAVAVVVVVPWHRRTGQDLGHLVDEGEGGGAQRQPGAGGLPPAGGVVVQELVLTALRIF